jgi:hypothetical protein
LARIPRKCRKSSDQIGDFDSKREFENHLIIDWHREHFCSPRSTQCHSPHCHLFWWQHPKCRPQVVAQYFGNKKIFAGFRFRRQMGWRGFFHPFIHICKIALIVFLYI